MKPEIGNGSLFHVAAPKLDYNLRLQEPDIQEMKEDGRFIGLAFRSGFQDSEKVCSSGHDE